ncbi:MAG TPA: tetratricopeptide repeat protein [Nitrospirales bacterium]|nr:tetratricopeptide repeat protein [Nitrospirales bacterium]HIO69196.1 tetratricopeptide repeat protein [Nitrospirales bacterium]
MCWWHDGTGISSAHTPSQGEIREQGHRALAQGEAARALRILEVSRELAESLDDRRGLALVMHDLGEATLLLHATQDVSHAGDYYRAAYSIALSEGDRHLQADSLTGLGYVAHLNADQEEAQSYYDEALGLYRELNVSLNERRGQASNLTNLGSIFEAQGQVADARHACTQALTIDKQIEDRDAIAHDLLNIARVLDHAGQEAEAMPFYHRAYRAFRALGKDDDTLTVLRRLVSLAQAHHEESAASDYEAELNDLVHSQSKLPSR